MPYETFTADASEDMDTESPIDSGRPKMHMPELTLQNAQKVLQFYQNEPQWLANPRTRHAASADFAQASKIIGINIQIERLNAQAEAARGKNTTSKQVGDSLLKLAEAGGDGAEWASQYYAQGSNGKPRFEDPSEWAGILKGYKQYAPKVQEEFADTVQMEDGTVLQGLRNPKTGVFKVQKTPKSETDEYVVKEFDGHKFLTGSGFKPIPLNSLTPEGKIDAQVQIETLRSLRKMTEDASDPEERKNLIQRQQNVLKVLKDITGGTPAATNAPAATAPKKVRVKGPNGQTGTVPKDAALPEGWTLE